MLRFRPKERLKDARIEIGQLFVPLIRIDVIRVLVREYAARVPLQRHLQRNRIVATYPHRIGLIQQLLIRAGRKRDVAAFVAFVAAAPIAAAAVAAFDRSGRVIGRRNDERVTQRTRFIHQIIPLIVDPFRCVSKEIVLICLLLLRDTAIVVVVVGSAGATDPFQERMLRKAVDDIVPQHRLSVFRFARTSDLQYGDDVLMKEKRRTQLFRSDRR